MSSFSPCLRFHCVYVFILATFSTHPKFDLPNQWPARATVPVITRKWGVLNVIYYYWYNCIYIFSFQNRMNAADDWTTKEVTEWLNGHGFSQYSDLLCAQHRIDGRILLTLTEHDLRQPPLQIPILGDIKRLIICIENLKDPQGLNTSIIPNGSFYVTESSRLGSKARRRGKFDSESVTDDEEDELFNTRNKKRHSAQMSRNLDPDIWKTLLSFVYVFCVFLLTAFVMVIVHDRVPDMEKYPPLPDIFLDNLPYIPWAFQVCEIVGVLLFSIWSSILIFHKHR